MYKVKVLRNGKIKIEETVDLNDKIVKMLNNVPEHIEKLNSKEKYLEILKHINHSFSFLLEKNRKYDNYQFAAEIKKYYGLENPKVKYFYDFLIAL